MDHLPVEDAVIEYEVQGDGEPVLLIPVGLIADGLGHPLLAQPVLASRYQLIHYHSRGYRGSTLGSASLTISRLAGDARALLEHLGVNTAHIVGHSISGLIALQLASEVPGLVYSLVLMEPPLRMVPSGKAAFERNILPMLTAYQAGNKRGAVEIFGENIFGPNWQSIIEHAIPGGVQQAMEDVDTFIQELSAIQAWQYAPEQAAAIHQPVLSVIGNLRENPYQLEIRALLHTWFPQIEDLDVPTTHLLQMQDPAAVARGLADFFSCHPMI